jgi:Ni/Co efflux regulator RcnB
MGVVMTRNKTKSSLRFVVVSIALALMAAGVSAEKPSWAGGGKNKEGKERNDQSRDDGRHTGAVAIGFGSDDRRIISEYYGPQVRKGKCPPGLAKKQNGCQPPGQAKKWKQGQPLAKDVKYYELPKELRIRLPVPPPDHRYVRIAGDILMIAVGTGMVVDAIEDILR